MSSGQLLAPPSTAAGYFSIQGFIEKGNGDTLNLPEGMVNVGGNGHGFIIDKKTNWNPTDGSNNDGTIGTLSLGDDVYIYAVRDMSGVATWVASRNSTVPTGSTASESRKIGGFHFGRVRSIANAFSSTYTCPVQIVPNSTWDLKNRPTCDPTGFARLQNGKWLSIYLMSFGLGTWPNSTLVSAFDAVPVTGADGYAYIDWINRMLPNSGMRAATWEEMTIGAYGMPQGATGQSDRINTGQTTGYGFDPVSCLNIDQPSGNVWQACSSIAGYGSGWHDSWSGQGKDGSDGRGQQYSSNISIALYGATWNHAGKAGSLAVRWDDPPWHVGTNVGVRAACDSLYTVN